MNDEYADDDKKTANEKHPFEGLNKIQVLQESRIFQENKPKAKKCIHLISKILYVLGQGVTLRKEEATSLFVQCTMLFGVKDKKLRRMLYLILKELAPSAEQTFIACSSLSSDMNRDQKSFPFKANVIRTLRAISDIQTFASLERHYVEALVDQDPSVSSSAIISGILVSMENMDMVKRWTKQVYTAMMSRFHMSQYHALALMYKIQEKDLLSVSKLILSNKNHFRTPLSHCLLVKYAYRVLRKNKNENSESSQKLLSFLEESLKNKNSMVVLETCRVIVKLHFLSANWISKVVTALSTVLLNSFEASAKSVSRFAALKILFQLADKFPELVAKCSTDLEKLIKSQNKTISTLAISTLLRCSSSDIDMEKLTTEIESVLRDVSDVYKVQVIESIKIQIPKSVKHHGSILAFLETCFHKTHARLEAKKSIVSCIIEIINTNPQFIEKGIEILCEFIEDCEYDVILQDIIHYLGEYGPKKKNPSMCIRYIYNRVFLERPSVRGAAIEALCKLGLSVEELKKPIIEILKKVSSDENDDVRERVMLSISRLEGVVELPNKMDINMFNLEKNLLDYLSNEESLDNPFDIESMVDYEEQEKKKEEEEKKEEEQFEEEVDVVENDTSLFFQIVQKIPKLKALGKPLKTCQEQLITESDADYIVRCIKHVYTNHIILQFNCTNNVENQKLVKVGIELNTTSVKDVKTSFGLNANEISYKQTQPILVCLQKRKGSFPVGKLKANLSFKIFEEDYDEDEYDDGEYELEDVKLAFKDYIFHHENPTFKEQWVKLGKDCERAERKTLPKEISKLPNAIKTVLNIVGVKSMNQIPKNLENKKSQALYFSLKLVTGEIVLMATKIVQDKSKSFKVMIYVKHEVKEVRDLLFEKLFQ